MNFKKWDFFYFSLYFYYKLSLQEHEKYLLSICFAFNCSEQCIKIISLRKKCGLFSSVFKKIISNNTPHSFQEVGGVT